MKREQRIQSLAELLVGAGKAHHEAFAAVDGADPDWAIWYSGYLTESLPAALGVPLSRTTIVCLLAELAEEFETRAYTGPWAEVYAQELVARFVPETEETMSLYIMQGCPYCIRVRHVIERLGVEVEMRDVFADPAHRTDLIAARGRATVPVLRCTGAGVDRWLPESRDIIRYLETKFSG